MASLINPYAKVHEPDQDINLIASANRAKKRRRNIVIFTFSAIILACVVVAALAGVVVSRAKNETSRQQNESLIISSKIKAICNSTLYPSSCYTSLAPLAINSGHFNPREIFRLSIQVAIDELLDVSGKFNSSNNNMYNDNATMAAVESCLQLLSLSIDHLNSSLTVNFDLTDLVNAFDDLRTWLSMAGTYQQTCIDGFENTPFIGTVVQALQNSTEFTSNSLAIITSIEGHSVSSFGRRLMSTGSSQRREVLDKSIVPNAVVAQDGSGKYSTINAAMKDVPNKSKTRYVIYVKKGTYVENVIVSATKWNVMMVGDGMDATLVSGSLNFVDGTPTFNTATFAALGRGFIARDMGFLNTAGAPKQQAVALLSASDNSLFHRCRIDAFQDSLYAHSNRQFYRECNIYGTVDFIFGNSAVVLQNCQIMPRRPIRGQQNTITAQGKNDPNQNTGISIQNCTISPFESLSGVSSYLGRPWKNYSTTIYMQSAISEFIDPKGWLSWTGSSGAPDTIFYAEYQNTGPGSVTDGRVNWKGLQLNFTSKQAGKFTVHSFINGDKWIAAANVTFKSTL
ncbi:hypothetical protein ABFS82_10G114900 [Erythranthe guttata]|uniref:Pectinesterase n=1 Tax=Erythranthe guttata TaxID=4155 RepID=A0A022RDJ3_ERYGU|nr:PREDICTED: pectinesterase-like [Erythranthe guttata]EYU38316.1 hypothetical protein MIMGU_mgv1a023297mg [Erythranthe guttata]|eukprot:XP_012836342.1 PREDICTED: pectinesterase-like [Erythranthe guttata]